MKKIVYPALFEPEEQGYNVSFPDLPGCFTCGDSLDEALFLAEDVLRGYLEWLEEDGESFPIPSDPRKIENSGNGFISLVSVWLFPMHEEKSVKKTLTIPKWLNDEAVKKRVNFSQVLQKELKKIVLH